jgi:hypothetical protein
MTLEEREELEKKVEDISQIRLPLEGLFSLYQKLPSI